MVSMTTTTTSTSELREDLQLLYIERALAESHGLTNDAAYMADLENDIAAHRNAYVGAAVTEIASLRGALSGPLHG
jgi:hypothetical protein